MNVKRPLLLLLLATHGWACATMYNGPTERITIVPDPSDAAAILIEQQMSGYFWLNFLWGPAFPVGMAVDAGSGAMWSLKPADVRLTLKPASVQ